ncbi:hypothetical protein MTR_4g107380 [Medicago truncatula]|uniref:Uncharacterized protein n=1 Tax=Medicago truncatula TaxID=3880 RepID=A0A072US65_MEDTR|nr:hypothetical protein MTR_4g107380 [Medicago truncatula]
MAAVLQMNLRVCDKVDGEGMQGVKGKDNLIYSRSSVFPSQFQTDQNMERKLMSAEMLICSC